MQENHMENINTCKLYELSGVCAYSKVKFLHRFFHVDGRNTSHIK